jgi:WD40 repeat protein
MHQTWHLDLVIPNEHDCCIVCLAAADCGASIVQHSASYADAEHASMSARRAVRVLLSGSSQSSAKHFEGDHWDLAALPRQLASITTSSSSHIIAAALAPDGSAVAAADRGRLRLFKLVAAAAADDDGDDADAGSGAAAGALAAQKVKVDAKLDLPVVCCAFSSDAQLLFAATGSGRVLAVDCSSGEVTASLQLASSSSSSINTGKRAAAAASRAQQEQQQQQVWCAGTGVYMPAVGMMAVAPSGHILALATAAGVELLSVPQLQPRGRLTLVGEPAPITALAFSPNSKFIAVGTAGNAVTAYSAETGMPTQWTLKNHAALADLLQQLPGSVQGLSFRPTPAEPLSLLVHSAGGLCHIDMAAGLSLHKPDNKQRRRPNPAMPQQEPSSELGRNGRLLKLQHSCLLLEHTSASEALLLEKPWAEQLQTLQPPLYRHRYGT